MNFITSINRLFTFIVPIFLIGHANLAGSQDYFEVLNTPDTLDVRTVYAYENGDILIGNSLANGGGLFKSEDNGTNWFLLAFEYIGVYEIEINELGYIYVRSGGDLYRSMDNGQTWEIIHYWGGGIESYPGGLMFASSSTGSYISLIRSTDYGNIWEEVAIYPSNVEYVKDIEIKNSDTIYVGTTKFTGEGGGVYRSTDGGDSWQHIGLSDHYVSSLALNTSGDLFAGTQGHAWLGGGGVFVMRKGQEEWVQIYNDDLVTSMVINTEDEIYIGCYFLDGYQGGVRRSADDGQSWEDISNSDMYIYHLDELVLDVWGYLYAVVRDSPTPLYRSIEPTTTSVYEQPNSQHITTYNYPNPFSDETTIYLSHPNMVPAEVQVTIFNSYGNIIEKMDLPKCFWKEQSIKWHSKQLPAGVYYYTITADNQYSINKMVLQK